MCRQEQEKTAEQHFRHRLVSSGLYAWVDYTRAEFEKRNALANVLEKTWQREAMDAKRDMVVAWKLRAGRSRDRRIQADLMFRTRNNAMLQVHLHPLSTLESKSLATGHSLDVGELHKGHAE